MLSGKQTKAKEFVYRGVVVPFELPDKSKAAALFDTELLRYAAVWTGGFIKFDGIIFNGTHGANPAPDGKTLWSTKSNPGWARGGDLKDPREKNKDPRPNTMVAEVPFGPLPRDWGRYKGIYRHEDGVVIEYTVGAAKVLDMPKFEVQDGQTFFCRTLLVEPGDGKAQQVVICDFPVGGGFKASPTEILATTAEAEAQTQMWVSFLGGPPGTALMVEPETALKVDEGGHRALLSIPAASSSLPSSKFANGLASRSRRPMPGPPLPKSARPST